MGFTSEENKAAIAEREAQIAKLQAEIKELRGPNGIASLTKNTLVTARKSYHGKGLKNSLVPDDWSPIVKVCLRVFRVSRVKDLSENQVRVAAEMADEIIEVFNKYYTLVRKEK